MTGDATTHQFSILQRGTALSRAWNHGVQTLLGGGLLGCRGVFVEIPMVSHGFPYENDLQMVGYHGISTSKYHFRV